MKTILALLLMIGALTAGLIVIAAVILVMAFAGAPGAIIYAKTRLSAARTAGLILAAVGQSFVVGAYAVFVVAIVRWFGAARPDIPLWPLWIAALIHSAAAPTYAMKEVSEEPTAQHETLGLAALAGTGTFLLAVFSPLLLSFLYGWVPLFGFLSTVPASKPTDPARQAAVDVPVPPASVPVTAPPVAAPPSTVVPAPALGRRSVESFFRGYKYLQILNTLQRSLKTSKDPMGDRERILELLRAALRSFEEVDPSELNGIHPEWGSVTVNYVVPGIRKLLSGALPEGDRADLARGDAMLAEYDSWLERNWNAIAAKVDE